MENRWGNSGNSGRLYFLGLQITANGDCSHEIQGLLLLERKAMTSLDSILNSRDITLTIKVHLIRALVFPVVMYGCENWTIKKAEHSSELMLLNCGAGEDSWDFLGLQGDQTSQFYRKSFLNIHWRDWSWSLSSNTLVTWYKELTQMCFKKSILLSMDI